MKKYNIIYADPPWSYYNDSTAQKDCTTVRGMRRPPYSVMSTDEICKLKVNNLADEDCLLFIWTTDYHLEKCIKVINSWGFEYKTIAFAWQKLTKNNTPVTFMCAYTMKSGIELCLLATKGKEAHKLVKKHNVRALIQSQRQEHSKKPIEVKERIIELVGDLPRIELFAREKTHGFDVWGNEVACDINLNN